MSRRPAPILAAACVLGIVGTAPADAASSWSEPGVVSKVTRTGDTLWALSTGGGDSTIASYTPSDGWTEQTIPDLTIADFTMVSTTDGWAIGEGSEFGSSTILRWDGSSWTEQDRPEGIQGYSDLIAISRAPGTDGVWILSTEDDGSGGFLLTHATHWDGTTWTDHETGYYYDAYDIRAVGDTEVWVSAGGDPEELSLAHFDGSTWETTDPGFNWEGTTVDSIGAAGGNDVWVSGTDWDPIEVGTSHWDGSEWTRIDVPAPLRSEARTSVDTTKAGNAWLATGKGVVGSWDGSAWQSVDVSGLCDGSLKLRAIDAVGGADVYIAGACDAQTLVAHYNGSSWTRL